jgi:transcription initiation factor TFIID subunit 11
VFHTLFQVAQTLLGVNSLPDKVGVVLIAIGKLFVGEIVEKSLQVMAERGDEGPIRPVHLREAYRRLHLQRRLASNKVLPPPRLFKRR